MLAWLPEKAQNNAIFVATMLSAAILVVTGSISLAKWAQSKVERRRPVGLLYHVPGQNPDAQKELSVGIGQHDVECILSAKRTVRIRYMYPPTFKGQIRNKPQAIGSAELRRLGQNAVAFVSGGFSLQNYSHSVSSYNMERDIITSATTIGQNDFRYCAYKVNTSGAWEGTATFEFYVEDIGRIRVTLPFCVLEKS